MLGTIEIGTTIIMPEHKMIRHSFVKLLYLDPSARIESEKVVRENGKKAQMSKRNKMMWLQSTGLHAYNLVGILELF